MEEKERYESKYNEKLMKHYAFDNENKEELGYKGVVRVLNQQDKRIKELEQDKTKFIDLLNSMTENWWVSYEKNKKLRQENKQLKQQLNDLPKKIVGEIRKEIEFPLYVHPDFDEFECLFDIDKLLDTILKKYGGENE